MIKNIPMQTIDTPPNTTSTFGAKNNRAVSPLINTTLKMDIPNLFQSIIFFQFILNLV